MKKLDDNFKIGTMVNVEGDDHHKYRPVATIENNRKLFKVEGLEGHFQKCHILSSYNNSRKIENIMVDHYPVVIIWSRQLTVLACRNEKDAQDVMDIYGINEGYDENDSEPLAYITTLEEYKKICVANEIDIDNLRLKQPAMDYKGLALELV